MENYYLVFCFREMQGFRLLCQKRNVSQTFKSSDCKSLFQVFTSLIQLASMNVFYSCYNWKTLFSYKFSVTPRFGATVRLLRSLKQVHILYILRSKIKPPLLNFSQKSYFLIALLLHFLILWVFHFFLYKFVSINEFLKIQKPPGGMLLLRAVFTNCF